MRRSNPYQRSHFSPRPPAGDPRTLILVFVTSLVAALVIMALVLPREVVLPAFSVWALAMAAGFALYAFVRADAARPLSAWDLAGACALIGCAAGIMGEIEPVLDTLRAPATRSKVND